MFIKAENNLKQKTHNASNMKEMEKKLNQGGFVKAPWCGKESCELKVKEQLQATTRCLCTDKIENKKCVCCEENAETYVYFARAY